MTWLKLLLFIVPVLLSWGHTAEAELPQRRVLHQQRLAWATLAEAVDPSVRPLRFAVVC
jgi:hypothetical protein